MIRVRGTTGLLRQPCHVVKSTRIVSRITTHTRGTPCAIVVRQVVALLSAKHRDRFCKFRDEKVKEISRLLFSQPAPLACPGEQLLRFKINLQSRDVAQIDAAMLMYLMGTENTRDREVLRRTVRVAGLACVNNSVL